MAIQEYKVSFNYFLLRNLEVTYAMWKTIFFYRAKIFMIKDYG